MLIFFCRCLIFTCLILGPKAAFSQETLPLSETATLEELSSTGAEYQKPKEPLLLAEAAGAETGGEAATTMEERPTLVDTEAMPTGGPRYKWWSVGIRSAIEYDRNVRLDDGSQRKSDLRNVVSGQAEIRLPKVLGVSTTVGYTFLKDFYDELDQFDTEGHIFSGGFNRPLTPNIFLSLDYSFIWFEFDGSGYLQRHGILPSLYWAHNESFASFLRFGWDNNDYVQVRELSGDNYSLALREFFFFGSEKQMYLYAEYASNYNKAVATFESFLGHKATLGYNTPVPGPEWLKLSFQTDFSYTNNQYKGKDPRFGNTFREDDIFTATVKLSRPIYKEYIRLQVSHSYLRHRSTFAGRDYTDQISGIEVQAKF